MTALSIFFNNRITVIFSALSYPPHGPVVWASPQSGPEFILGFGHITRTHLKEVRFLGAGQNIWLLQIAGPSLQKAFIT